MRIFAGGPKVVGTLSAYSTGMGLRAWREIRDTAEGNTRVTPSWVAEGKGGPTDGFVSREKLQREIFDLWRRGLASGRLPDPYSIRARLNRFWLWVTRRRDR
jgi:hypothetical protein